MVVCHKKSPHEQQPQGDDEEWDEQDHARGEGEDRGCAFDGVAEVEQVG